VSGPAEAAVEAAVLAVIASDAAARAALGDPARVNGGTGRPAYPFLEVTRHERIDAGGSSAPSWEHRMDLVVLGRDGERTPVSAALAAARSALEAQPPQPAGGRCVLCTPVFSDILRTAEGWRGLLRLKLVVEAA
jgi:hypothetical protein